ncbi:RNA polymerase sigma factor [Actinosynnema sp. CA-248983]
MNGGNDSRRRRAEFEEFYREKFTFLWHDARRHMPAPESEDIVHEVLTRMWRLWDEIEGPRLNYARTAIKNLVNERRRQATSPIPVEDHHSALVAPVEDVETRQRVSDLLERISELPPHLGQVLLMRMYGYDNGEIARRTGCAIPSVSTYGWKAKRLLDPDHPVADRKSRTRGIRNDDRGDA